MGISRRKLLKSAGLTPFLFHKLLSIPLSCASDPNSEYHITGLMPDYQDRLHLHPELTAQILLREEQEIADGLFAGVNHDYLQFFPLTDVNHGVLWVNHEYVYPILHSDEARTKKNIDAERKLVGGSLIEIKKLNNKWEIIKNSPYNKRIDGTTKIPFKWDQPIEGSKVAEGTLGNCAGGKTPWSTVLTCEENYNMFYAEGVPSSWLQWEKFYPNPPEHYGWVVEINPMTGEAMKHPGLGRMAHECATFHPRSKNKAVFYTGDDANDEHLYKFISSSPSAIEDGVLYVAHFESKKWIPLDLELNPKLKKHFKNKTEMLIQTRKAAKIVDATPLDRPEDIEIDPISGDVIIALTNNKKHGRPHGKILRIKEKNQNPESLSFDFSEFLVGGPQNNFSCPDNLAFDNKGNLWFTTDMAGTEMHQAPYDKLGNNSLFVVPRNGSQAGSPIRVASAPKDAEFTGPLFSPDGESLFLSVQHPGETTKIKGEWTSQWPDQKKPQSAVIVLSGKLFEKL